MDIGRRAFLTGLSGTAVLVLAGCTPDGPSPAPTGSGTPTPTPTAAAPTPFATSTTGLPSPAEALRSRWGRDPYSLGSTTYLPPGVGDDVRDALRRPVGDRVFLAGEGVAARQAGTLPGARASGFDVADAVGAVAEPGERIAVVGAGVAGATAARSLADRGHDVVVLEARTRVGGRVHSPDGGGWAFPPELGGGALWGRGSTALRVVLEIAGVTTVPFVPVTEARVTTDAPTDDAAPTDAPVADPGDDATPGAGTAGGATTDLLDDAVRQALATATAWAGGAAGADGAPSVEDALRASGARDALGDVPDGTGTTDADRLAWLTGDALAARTGADAGSLPVGVLADDALVPADARLVTGGLQGFVDGLLDGLDVLPGATVVHLRHGDAGVALRLATGESLSVDRAVVTVPVAVLRDDAVEFEPALPNEHREALDALGVGQQETLWLRFDEAFWTTTATVWAVLDDDAAFRVWLNLLPTTGQPVLVALTGGTAAERLAELDDDATVEAALASLRPYLDLPEGAPEPSTAPATEPATGAPDAG